MCGPGSTVFDCNSSLAATLLQEEELTELCSEEEDGEEERWGVGEERWEEGEELWELASSLGQSSSSSNSSEGYPATEFIQVTTESGVMLIVRYGALICLSRVSVDIDWISRLSISY